MKYLLIILFLTGFSPETTSLLGSEVNIESDLNRAERNFCCSGETVIYYCSSTRNALLLTANSLFVHLYTNSTPVPSVMTFPSGNIVLTSKTPDLTANIQITAMNQSQVNVTCSSGVPGSEKMLPLIQESNIVPPSNLTCKALGGYFVPLINVSWTPPINTLFDIDYYIVTSYLDGQFYSNTTTHNNNIILKLPPGEISIDVSTVSTCGTISRPIKCDRTSPAGHFVFYPFNVPLMTAVIFEAFTSIIVGIVCYYCGKRALKVDLQIEDVCTAITEQMPKKNGDS